MSAADDALRNAAENDRLDLADRLLDTEGRRRLLHEAIQMALRETKRWHESTGLPSGPVLRLREALRVDAELAMAPLGRNADRNDGVW